MKIIPKTGWFWSLLNVLVIIVTFGGNRKFMTGSLTTIGPWCAVPIGFDATSTSGQIALAHEERHYRQYKMLGLGSPVLGILPFAVAYLFLPLPFGLAWCRYALERAAVADSIRAWQRIRGQGTGDATPGLIEIAVKQLSGPLYAWCWPFPGAVRRWLARRVGGR